jgi:hypothetical protein
MSDDKSLEQLEAEAGCFLSMPKEKYDEFLAKKKAAKGRAKSKKGQ